MIPTTATTTTTTPTTLTHTHSDKLDELSEKHASLDNSEAWDPIDASLRAQVNEAVAALKMKLAARQMDDDKRKAARAVGTVERQTAQSDYNWWKEGWFDGV